MQCVESCKVTVVNENIRFFFGIFEQKNDPVRHFRTNAPIRGDFAENPEQTQPLIRNNRKLFFLYQNNEQNNLVFGFVRVYICNA
jgi:hypothetical protein